MNIYSDLSKSEEEKRKERENCWRAKRKNWTRINRMKEKFLNAQKEKGKED